ncbi:MAG: UDP-N-acetylmuramoyl-L-alanyl-D-glutamate--2,6-diaminopimelate ligase [Rhodospirillaceae bacterium]|nr:UDP-N-acetylmuramoyl-L-alanyl-D-glutamate--2,6-diaminopimelate ligase [Rhodospirillaceae bacterium]
MRLSDLLEEQGMNFQARPDLDIAGLTEDSRKVQPGFLFAALSGSKADGRAYIADAIKRGARAILAPPGTVIDQADLDATARVIFDSNPRRRFALLASRFYNKQPGTVAAVTGTNGKTSAAHFARQLWTVLGRDAGYIGTLGAFAPGYDVPGSLTTPDPVHLHRILAAMADTGVTHLAMEASSHGLHQYRIDGVRLSIGGFTTLSRDHLDYHGSMAAYIAAKLRLFSEVMLPGGVAVLNADSSEFPAFEAACRLRGHKVISYGKAGTTLQVVESRIVAEGFDLKLAVFGKSHRVLLPLAGTFQVGNALCALGFVLASGADPDAAVAALGHLKGVPGRMEYVGASKDGAPVFVDYAHTPDAIETVLAALRPHTQGKLAIVFGCGGDRDRGKRRLMGERATALADQVYVTDDNPRSEVPAAIRAEILQGAPGAAEIGDRAEAISVAIAKLSAGDVLLLAGKGHETGQTVGGKVIPFDDREVARDVLRAAGGKV